MAYVGRKPSFLQSRINELTIPAGIDVTTAGTITALSVADSSNIRLTNASIVAGIVAPVAPIVSGKVLLITNASSNPMFVNDEDAAATAANRIITSTSAPVQVSPGSVLMLAYDSAAARWRILGGTGSGSGGGYFKNYLELFFSSDVAPTVNNGGVSAAGNRTAPANVWSSPNTANFSFSRVSSGTLRGLFSYQTTGSANGAAAFVESPTFVLDTSDTDQNNGSRALSILIEALVDGPTMQLSLVRYSSSNVIQEELVFGTFQRTAAGQATFPVAFINQFASISGSDLFAFRLGRLSGTGQCTWDRTTVTPDQPLTNDRQAFRGQKVFTSGVQTSNTPTISASAENSIDIIPVGETRFAGRLVVPASRTINVSGDLAVVGAITGTGALTGSGTITGL